MCGGIQSRMAEETPIVALVRDLMFSSKIRSEAQAAGVAVRMVREPGQLAGAGGRLLLADLNQPGAIEAAARWLAADPARAAVGFISHVDADTAARARAAGIRNIVARSAFVAGLPQLLKPA
jgi:hypothetical protein